jgi:CheY-like chemotaxis protein/HPt (histidine-containing phosphotransfer) domain-containing protein
MFPQTTIVMITSDDLPAYSARARRVGASGFLVKPVSTAELLAAVRTALSGATQEAGAGAAQEPSAQNEHYRVLLAEDNEVNRLLVHTQIESQGWSIASVEDGRAALEILSREPFDVVLMDVQMPVMDGFEATRALRNIEREAKLRRTPVIGLTAHALREDRQRCLDAGMDDYLAKPTEPLTLFQTIRRHARRATEGRDKRLPPAEFGPSLRDKPALRRKLTETFLNDYPGKLAELKDAVEGRAPEEIGKVVHNLLGTLLILGANPSVELARRLETCVREGRLEETPAIFESLEQEVQRLAGFLTEHFND